MLLFKVGIPGLATNMYSVIVSGGVVVDGSGSPPFKGCVAVEEDKVAFVGGVIECGNPEAENITDAPDLYVAPGFTGTRGHLDETPYSILPLRALFFRELLLAWAVAAVALRPPS